MRAVSNLLLVSLPPPLVRELLLALSPTTLAFGTVLWEPGRAMSHVYFPETCIVSMLVGADPLTALEVAMIGPEGLVGVPVALGAQVSTMRAIVQAEGRALRMTSARFRTVLQSHAALQRGVYAYAHALMWQIAQTAACNRFHPMNARLARWLLMTRDRLGSSEMLVTQEFLSAMLGVRRVGVSEAASAFQLQQLISYKRGVVTILDHEGLEAASCSCYARAQAQKGSIASWRPVVRAA